MKLIAPFLLFTISEGAKVGKTIKDLVPNMDTLHREHVHNRILEVSAQCQADTEALYTNNPALDDAYAAWEAE
jgi:hypothetical protein